MSHHHKDRNRNGTGSTTTEAPAQDTASKVTGMARDVASNVGQQTAAAGSFIAHKADDAASTVGGEMKSLAGTIRDKGPHEGMLGNASSAVASTLESAGQELEQGLGVMVEDVTSLVRRHPVPAILIGIGLGVLIARVVMK